MRENVADVLYSRKFGSDFILNNAEGVGEPDFHGECGNTTVRLIGKEGSHIFVAQNKMSAKSLLDRLFQQSRYDNRLGSIIARQVGPKLDEFPCFIRISNLIDQFLQIGPLFGAFAA